MPESQELIDIREVADTFGKSVESIRKYKNFGIIRVTDKRGNKDLFNRDEILKIRDRLRELRLKGLSLSQVADQMDALRREDIVPLSDQADIAPRNPLSPDPTQAIKVLIVDDEIELRGNIGEFDEYGKYI